jgi:acetyl-CoA carboxylase biotin carboxylase subunit
MKSFGIPVISGSDGPIKTVDEGLELAKSIGFPVIIKASGGGGGKGMRIASNELSFRNGFDLARGEAGQAFGNDEVYIEKYLDSPRHIEIQVFGDDKQNAVHFFERECSIQRRHQKLIEEAPCAFINKELREKMGEVSVTAIKALSYRNAGTIEYLVDKNGDFYFMEMNTRIQVEHPVTEYITGIDLLKLQIIVANGEPIPFTQDKIELRGHSIECRINAEDPENFTPSTGDITEYYAPTGLGVRVESACYTDCRVLPYYDSMIAKLVTWGLDRSEAISRMKRSLDEYIIQGVKTSIPLHKKIIEHFAFVKGDLSTDFIEKYFS